MGYGRSQPRQQGREDPGLFHCQWGAREKGGSRCTEVWSRLFIAITFVVNDVQTLTIGWQEVTWIVCSSACQSQALTIAEMILDFERTTEKQICVFLIQRKPNMVVVWYFERNTDNSSIFETDHWQQLDILNTFWNPVSIPPTPEVSYVARRDYDRNMGIFDRKQIARELPVCFWLCPNSCISEKAEKQGEGTKSKCQKKITPLVVSLEADKRCQWMPSSFDYIHILSTLQWEKRGGGGGGGEREREEEKMCVGCVRACMCVCVCVCVLLRMKL